jgi:hypothetical protein
MNNVNFFRENKYVTLKNIVSPALCSSITKYALNKEKTNFTSEESVSGGVSQVKNVHACYRDPLIEKLLGVIKPSIEINTGLSLHPTYTYYRVYRPGMKLDRHVDRPSCEISVSVCFGSEYKDVDPEYRWGIYMDPGVSVKQNPGDGVIYRGHELPHWREEFDAGPDSYQVQVFFHFIDMNGPHYPEWSTDGMMVKND